MANEVEIIIRAVDKASKEIDQMSKKSKGSFDKFRAAVIAGGVAISGAMILAKKAFDMGKEGAQLEFVRGKFDNLAQSIGTTSDVLLNKLRSATRGTRSDMELAASAADFMSLGLARSSDQVVRLTRVAGALNMDMNQLVLTLANKTTMRFDQLGVSVDGFDDKLKELQATGLSVQDAFTEAFLQQAELQIEKVGDVADTNAGKIMKMDAAVANLSNSFKMRMAPAVAESAEAIASSLNQMELWSQQIEVAQKSGEKFDSTLRAYKGGFVGLETAVFDAGDAMARFKADDLITSLGEAATAAEEAASAINNVSIGLGEVTQEKAAAMAMDELNQLWEDGEISGQDYRKAALDIMTGLGDMTDEAAQTALQVFDLNRAYDEGELEIRNYIRALEDITSKEWVVKVKIQTEGALPEGATTRRRASGGPVSMGQPYIVGERGPELFVPTSSGRIVSNAQTTGGGSIGGDIINNIYPSPGMDEYALANYTALVLGQRARRSALAGAGYVGQ